MSDTDFVNVDLEVASREPLDGLVEALGDRVDVMYHGEARGRFLAAFELAHGGGDAGTTLDGLCVLIERMDPDTRAIWNRSMSRTMDIGFESGTRPDTFRTIIHPSTLRRIAAIDVALVVTIYASPSTTSE